MRKTKWLKDEKTGRNKRVSERTKNEMYRNILLHVVDNQVTFKCLIPHWIKSLEEAIKISNITIKARSETMFEKPAFREAARSRRCLVLVDGFFEHHHKGGKTFSLYVQLRSLAPMTLAGLWDEWKDSGSGLVRSTYTIVTTAANPMTTRHPH